MATLTGRLTAISQWEPSLLGLLHSGYTVVSAALRKGRRRYRMAPTLQLSRGSRAFRELQRLMDAAALVLAANEGVPWAAPTHFRPLWSRGVVASLTDASRADADDGVGGFIFHPAFPGVVWVASEEWPADIKVALDNAAQPRWRKRLSPPLTQLSMPGAEIFGCGAVPAAVHAVVSTVGWHRWATQLDSDGIPAWCDYYVPVAAPVEAVYAVGDCSPAAAAMRLASSTVPQIRCLLLHQRLLTEQWLGVQVSRDFNKDADRLSHPSMLRRVMADAILAGFEPRVVPLLQSSWENLREAIHASPDEPL